eukprot:1156636-Pelagomonas_calceolata.AAC.10
MLEDQGCSDSPHLFPSVASHPSKHGQHVHSQELDAAASLEVGKGGEGPHELEGRVRILLGVLERERRGREEERQKKCELERALEEAQQHIGCCMKADTIAGTHVCLHQKPCVCARAQASSHLQACDFHGEVTQLRQRLAACKIACSQLQACDFQAEITQLKQRVARLQDDHPAQLGPLFDMYERDMARADAANKWSKQAKPILYLWTRHPGSFKTHAFLRECSGNILNDVPIVRHVVTQLIPEHLDSKLFDSPNKCLTLTMIDVFLSRWFLHA